MLKRLLASLTLLAVAGFGCAAPVPLDTTAYVNEQYGFSFGYPSNIEVRVREEENRETQYLGLDADFFASVRDTVRDKKATNIFFLYALPGATVDSFTAALAASNPDGTVQVTSVEDVEANGFEAKKVISTTEMGRDKTHYLFEADGALVVASVFLTEEAVFETMFQTFRRE